MIIEKLIKKITLDFIILWNKWEIDEVMKYLKDDIVIYSPYIKMAYPENTACRLEGKENVKQYWIYLMNNIGRMQFELESFSKVKNEVSTVNKIIGRDEKMYAVFTYNEYAKISSITFEYK